MIEIAPYTDLYRAGYSLAYHCWRCRRWSDIDLAAIIAAGRGGQAYVGKRPPCIDCGEYSSMQVQPPHRRIGTTQPKGTQD